MLRIYTRKFLVRSLGWDDFTIVLALFSSLGLSLLWSFQSSYGLGQPFAKIPPQSLESNIKMTWAGLLPYYASLSLVKVSALLQMLRIFQIPRVRTSCLFMLAFMSLFGIWTLISAFIVCHPLEFTWNKTIPDGHCTDSFPILYTNAGINIATDIVITLLPLRILSRLTLTPAQKRGLMAVFALGILASIPSLLRLHALVALHHNPADPSATPSSLVWTTLEANTTIILACIPALGPLLTRLHLFRSAAAAGAVVASGNLSMALSSARTIALEPSAYQKGACVRERDIDDDDDDDVEEFAGLTGLTGDAEFDGRLLAARMRERLMRPRTGSSTAGVAGDCEDDGVVSRVSSTAGMV